MPNLFPDAPTYADPVIVDPQTGLASFNPLWLKWFLDIAALLSSFGGGSGGVDHALLTNLNSTTYTHLSAPNATDLTDAGDSALHYHATDRNSANFTGTNWTDLTDAGDSTLHYHATDRARANHTGTQALATISDVTVTATNLNTLDDGADSTLHYHAADRARANHTGTQTLSTISDALDELSILRQWG